MTSNHGRKATRHPTQARRDPAALPTLGLSETQVVHVALANLARQTLPRYEPDDGPLTPEQLAAIDKLVPQGRFKPSKRLF